MQAPLPNYRSFHFKTLLLLEKESMKFGMHIVPTIESTMICICAGKLPYGPRNGLCADPVPLRSSAGASLEVVLRAALGLVVSNSVLVQYYWLFSIK